MYQILSDLLSRIINESNVTQEDFDKAINLLFHQWNVFGSVSAWKALRSFCEFGRDKLSQEAINGIFLKAINNGEWEIAEALCDAKHEIVPDVLTRRQALKNLDRTKEVFVQQKSGILGNAEAQKKVAYRFEERNYPVIPLQTVKVICEGMMLDVNEYIHSLCNKEYPLTGDYRNNVIDYCWALWNRGVVSEDTLIFLMRKGLLIKQICKTQLVSAENIGLIFVEAVQEKNLQKANNIFSSCASDNRPSQQNLNEAIDVLVNQLNVEKDALYRQSIWQMLDYFCTLPNENFPSQDSINQVFLAAVDFGEWSFVAKLCDTSQIVVPDLSTREKALQTLSITKEKFWSDKKSFLNESQLKKHLQYEREKRHYPVMPKEIVLKICEDYSPDVSIAIRDFFQTCFLPTDEFHRFNLCGYFTALWENGVVDQDTQCFLVENGVLVKEMGEKSDDNALNADNVRSLLAQAVGAHNFHQITFLCSAVNAPSQENIDEVIDQLLEKLDTVKSSKDVQAIWRELKFFCDSKNPNPPTREGIDKILSTAASKGNWTFVGEHLREDASHEMLLETVKHIILMAKPDERILLRLISFNQWENISKAEVETIIVNFHKKLSSRLLIALCQKSDELQKLLQKYTAEKEDLSAKPQDDIIILKEISSVHVDADIADIKVKEDKILFNQNSENVENNFTEKSFKLAPKSKAQRKKDKKQGELLSALEAYIDKRKEANFDYSPGFFGLKKHFRFKSQCATQKGNVLLAEEVLTRWQSGTLSRSDLNNASLKEIRDERTRAENLVCRKRGSTSLNKIIHDLKPLLPAEKKPSRCCFS